MKTLGTILLVIGALLIVFTGFEMITTHQFADIDPIEINNPNKLSFYWSPITAVALLVAGAAVLIIRKREKGRTHRYYR